MKLTETRRVGDVEVTRTVDTDGWVTNVWRIPKVEREALFSWLRGVRDNPDGTLRF